MSSLNSLRLRELIRSVRSCKTAYEERALINKECATIREGFQEGTPYVRTRNMLKLLYIGMLGYATEFGQLEVINLLAQSDFSGKRLGYLALQLLLDENDEVLTLAENHMKNDMGSSNYFVQAVALNAAANIASEDMARDMFDEAMKLVACPNPYIKKKACLAALRIVRKVPEHAEYFLEKFNDVFQDRHSGSLLCSVTLINECLRTEQGAAFMGSYRKLATTAVRVLKALVLSARVTEQDVSGITDPFLQVKILQFMGIIGRDSAVTSEALNDVLAQVITNTDSARNVGCAVQYECVRTIDNIESDSGLRSLAINTITRFLSSSRDNNLRFVALQTLLNFSERNVEQIQKYQNTILECLKDPDLSIRKRALELTVSLVTDDNVRLLVPDLLSYLDVCADCMRGDVTKYICNIIENKSPSDEWRVDMSLKLLIQARHYAAIEFATRLIGVISNQSETVQARATRTLWTEASYPFDALHQARKAFLVAALWCLGEYADLLIAATGITELELATCLNDITVNTTYGIVKRYGLTALMKFSTRFPDTKSQAMAVFRNKMTSLDCELQQRACEYSALMRNFTDDATFCFSRMPPISAQSVDVKPVQVVSFPPEVLKQHTANTLDDLFNFDGPSSSPAGVDPTAKEMDSNVNLVPEYPPNDVIDSLFGGGSGATASTAAARVSVPPAVQHFDPVAPAPAPAPLSAAPAGVTVFSCADFDVTLVASALSPDSVIHTQVLVHSKMATSMDQLSFQVAVPKTCTVEVAPLLSTSIPPYGTLEQRLSVNTSNIPSNPRQLMLRIKLLYATPLGVQEELFQVSHEV